MFRRGYSGIFMIVSTILISIMLTSGGNSTEFYENDLTTNWHVGQPRGECNYIYADNVHHKLLYYGEALSAVRACNRTTGPLKACVRR